MGVIIQFEGKAFPLSLSCWPLSGKHMIVSSGTTRLHLQITHLPPTWQFHLDVQQACPKLGSNLPNLPPHQLLLHLHSSPHDSIHPAAQAKILQVIFHTYFFHPTSNPSMKPVGLTLKYIKNAITSDHLHCRHQLSPGLLRGLLSSSHASTLGPTTVYFQ